MNKFQNDSLLSDIVAAMLAGAIVILCHSLFFFEAKPRLRESDLAADIQLSEEQMCG